MITPKVPGMSNSHDRPHFRPPNLPESFKNLIFSSKMAHFRAKNSLFQAKKLVKWTKSMKNIERCLEIAKKYHFRSFVRVLDHFQPKISRVQGGYAYYPKKGVPLKRGCPEEEERLTPQHLILGQKLDFILQCATPLLTYSTSFLGPM